MRTKDIFVLLCLDAALGGLGTAYAQLPNRIGDFTLEVMTDEVRYARQIAEAEDGTLFVGSFNQRGLYSNLYAVVPGDGDPEVVVVDSSLFYPSGVVLVGADLYVAALNRVLRYPNILETFRDNPEPTVITSSLPTDTHHGWKYLSIGSDGYLYVPVGAPCNICDRPDDERYATILRMDPDTGETTVYARGVRNSVGMAWHPVTGQLWFSENGRDWPAYSGDDVPAEEINRVVTLGSHYGFPYFYQDNRPGEPVDYRDPVFGGGKNADDYLRSEHLIQAHSAALGIAFYTGDQFPSRYCGAMFIAEHGSWNRTSQAGKVGYRVGVLRFANPDAPRGAGAVYEPFVDVWLNHQSQRHTGRPNDAVVSRNGSLLIADDFAGAIYRVSYAPEDSGLDPITGCAETAHVSTFSPKSHATRQGFVRVVNNGDSEAAIRMDAFDDTGRRRGPVTLTVGVGEAAHFNSEDLEDGNDSKGLSGSVGSGSGDWRIELRGDDVEVLSYMRTQDGFVTSLHDVAPLLEPVSVTSEGRLEHRYDVPIFNPGRNTDQVSWLRLVNPGEVDAEITITGIDDTGKAAENHATLSLPGGASRSVSAQDLESGAGLAGEQGLNAGTGKWRLVVTSDRPILVASLLASPTGHLTNLSTVPDNQVTDGTGTTHLVPLFPEHGDANDRQGFVRIVNRSDQGGSVTVNARDDTDRVFDTLTLDVAANAAVHFNSENLETGNADHVPDGIGAGEGDWRLTLAGDLDLDVFAYIRRTSDGFLTSMHDFVRRRGDGTYAVPFFNPGRNTDQMSRLRIVNSGDENASVTIRGIDDAGQTTGTVRLTVPKGTARTLSSQELEAGGDDFPGMGTGTGKWRLIVMSEQPVRVMSLLESPTGHLTNLSTVPASH